MPAVETTARLVLSMLFSILLISPSPVHADDRRHALPASAIELVEHNVQPLVHVAGTPNPQTLAERMAYYNIPGISVAVIHEGKLDWAKDYGVIEAGSKIPVTPFKYFEAASISKPITALMALVLAQEARIDLDAPIERYLKSWHIPVNDLNSMSPPTARQIMCHHAGFNVEYVSGYTSNVSIPSLLEVLNGYPPSNTTAVKTIETPGKNFRYSAGGFLVLQQALMDISGKDFFTLAEEKLFHPLGMRTSTFTQPSLSRTASGVVKGHGFDGVPTARRKYPEESAAGLRTTARDLCLVIMEIQNALKGSGKIFKKETAEKILTAQGEKPRIGLGFFLDAKDKERRFSMDGWNYGFTCRMVGFADRGDGAVVMTNGDNGALMFEVLDSIARAYAWPVPPVDCKQAQPILPQQARTVAGRYDWSETEQAEVLAQGARVFLHVYNKDQKTMDPFPPAELFAKSQSEFFSVFPPMELRFDSDSSGRVSALSYKKEGKQVRARCLADGTNH